MTATAAQTYTVIGLTPELDCTELLIAAVQAELKPNAPSPRT